MLVGPSRLLCLRLRPVQPSVYRVGLRRDLSIRSFLPASWRKPKPVDRERDYALTRGGPIKKYRRGIWLYLLFLLPAFAFSLGYWQIKRLKWKNDLIADLKGKVRSEAMRLPRIVDLDAIQDFQYRRVAVRGRFDHDREVLVGPRRIGQFDGYDVITPFVRNPTNEPGDGPVPDILINRGFLRRENAPLKMREKEWDFSETVVVGFLRAQTPRTKHTPTNDPTQGQWPFLDQRQIARWTGTDAVLLDEIFVGGPSEIEQRHTEGKPVGRAPTVEVHNMHAVYAGTWFTLGAGTFAMAVFLLTA